MLFYSRTPTVVSSMQAHSFGRANVAPKSSLTQAVVRQVSMNIQQMQDAVYEGVLAAMMVAMRGNGEGSGSQVIRVYLDGKEVASSVEKAQRERGASIMGNEVYSY